MSRILTPLSAISLSLAGLTGCTTAAIDAPVASATPSAPVGLQASAALGETAILGSMALTPEQLIEDSRCPANARCIWAGRLVIAVHARGTQSAQRIQATLGEPFTLDGRAYALVAALPDRVAGADAPPATYRFTFEAR